MEWLKRFFTTGQPSSSDNIGEDDRRLIKLQSSDNQVFEIPQAVAYQMKAVREMAEQENHAGGECLFPLPNVTSTILKRVIEYCQHHADETKENDTNKTEDLEEWDQYFVTDSIDSSGELVLYQIEILMAANYLNVESLQELMCMAVAKALDGRSLEDVREIFGVENDYTPEEEAELRKEYSWVFN